MEMLMMGIGLCVLAGGMFVLVVRERHTEERSLIAVLATCTVLMGLAFFAEHMRLRVVVQPAETPLALRQAKVEHVAPALISHTEDDADAEDAPPLPTWVRPKTFEVAATSHKE